MIYVFVDEGQCQDAKCAKIKLNIMTKLVSFQQQEEVPPGTSHAF